jgi:hypothetical protein
MDRGPRLCRLIARPIPTSSISWQQSCEDCFWKTGSSRAEACSVVALLHSTRYPAENSCRSTRDKAAGTFTCCLPGSPQGCMSRLVTAIKMKSSGLGQCTYLDSEYRLQVDRSNQSSRRYPNRSLLALILAVHMFEGCSGTGHRANVIMRNARILDSGN